MSSFVQKHTVYNDLLGTDTWCSEWSRAWTTIHNLHAVGYYLWIVVVVDDTDVPELEMDISGIGWEHKIN